MTTLAPEARAEHLLSQRLRAIAQVLLGSEPAPQESPAQDAAQILDRLVRRQRTSHQADPASLWLLVVGLTGAFPTRDEMLDCRRRLELATTSGEATVSLLDLGHEMVRSRGEIEGVEIEVVQDRVVLDADYSARHDHHTGIQRVARSVSSRWVEPHGALPVAWTASRSGYRALAADEQDRLLRWGRAPQHTGDPAPTPARLVVPWRCAIVLLEVPPQDALDQLAALAQHSSNRVVAVGYDAIPITSIDLRPLDDATVFVRYLSMLRHAHHVAGISASAATEFRGFSEALVAQGVTGPDVTEVLLASEAVGAVRREAATDDGERRVLVIGSHEIHKNHLAVLHAAERLWRSGVDFTLQFVGGQGSAWASYRERVDALTAAGRPVVDLGRLSDEDMWRTCREATFTVFPSLHEGYGLPVAESLACGTPVITSDYGSMREIAAGGGCLLVDPRDDDDLEAGMRRLLTEPELLARLSAEALAAPVRTWDAYAAELWDVVTSELSKGRRTWL